MKNPWMSMWLSAANKAAGAARGLGRQSCTVNRRPWPRGRARHGFRAMTSKTRAPAKRRKSGFIARSGAPCPG